jgi:hypothetical protein
LVYKRVLLGGIASSLFKGDLKLIKNPVRYLSDTYEDTIGSRSLLLDPRFLGVYNNLIVKVSSLKKFYQKGGVNLFNIAKDLTSLDYNTIYNKDKLKLAVLLKMGTLTRRSFRVLPIISEFHDFDSTCKSTNQENESHPEKLLYFAYYHLMDNAIRKITWT